MGKIPGGTWSDHIWCPYGTRVNGFKLRIEPSQGVGNDNTGLNGIQLSCNDGSVSERIIGLFGDWLDWVYCKDGAFVHAFDVLSLDVISPIGDNTGANNVKMMCSNGEELIVDGLDFGTWEGYKSCPAVSYLCGVQAQIQKNQQDGDDRAVNRIEFQCCPEKGKGITARGFK